MADTPHRPAHRPRPMSPFLTVYRWTPTMAASITHRVSGIGLGFGLAVLTWWLFAAARGPEVFGTFLDLATTPLGQVILFGFTWALSFHLLNGIRHLAWDLGYGFGPKGANMWSIAIYVLSVLVPVGLFALAYTGNGGFYQ
jgi:succinate dehydrogenase / fumarate reductase cytochrome b subunit